MTSWQLAVRALQLLHLDPSGLGGVVIRGRPGPARDTLLAGLRRSARKLPPHLTATELLGGIDMADTLGAGTLVRTAGLLNTDQRTFLLPMAERMDSQMAGILATHLDRNPGQAFLALDEGDEDEALPRPLAERLALQISLEDIPLAEVAPADLLPQCRTEPVEIAHTDIETLIQVAVSLGVHSLRAPYFAIRAAQANARLLGRNRVESEDIETAATLVYAHRATQLPQAPEDPETPDSSDPPEDTNQTPANAIPPADMLLEAVLANIPPDLLAQLGTGASRGGAGAGAGKTRIGNRRGRPLPARNRRADRSRQIDLMATLRAAMPWQGYRKALHPDRTGPIILPEDLRQKRFAELSDRLLIFTVDASGSAALARLAEAKGAVELLLGEAYARRDHVALIGFRGTGAELLLPPTRSLVQTKRRLAGLPGGGGTPLAAGLKEAAALADQASRKGMTPVVVLLTDGRANIDLSGAADRHSAGEDARKMATLLRATGVQSLVIDAGNRPEKGLAHLAHVMGGQYRPLPRADAQRLSQTVSTALAG